MSPAVQYLLVAFIVAVAAGAIARTVVRTLRNQRTALTSCAGCKLQDICNKPEKNSAKKCADKVAQVKKSQ